MLCATFVVPIKDKGKHFACWDAEAISSNGANSTTSRGRYYGNASTNCL